MSRTATLKKAATNKTSTIKGKTTSKTANKSKVTKLKIVKPVAEKASTKSVAKKTAPKAKSAAKKAAPIKKVTKAAAKAAPVNKALAKEVAKKKTAATTATTKTSSKKSSQKMVARPINVTSGFNRAARINSIVQKRAKANNIKKQEGEFNVGCHVVYPTHGVGQIVDEETQEIGGITLKMFVIEFVKDKMTLRVPVHRAKASGLRHVSSNNEIKKMYDTLKSKAKTSRGMWSRRAQEYEAKINSGDVIMIAEVVRDLHQNVDQAERSYSERMIYESAFGRLAGELSASETLEYNAAGDKLLKLLRAKKAA